VLTYGDTVTKAGLNLLDGPGNDIVSVTNLSAVGCHMVLFTTGRGTPLGGAVPTLKISSNDSIASRKPHWIDFNAFGNDKAQICNDLFKLVVDTANGKETNNELHGYREIAIFKDGVTL
jgi:altronate hydrolase